MERTKRASIEFSLIWKSLQAQHRDRFHFSRIIFWRDIFPGGFADALPGMAQGEERTEDFDAGVLVPCFSSRNVFPVMEFQIDFRSHGKTQLELRPGRFYPRGIVQSPYTFPKETRPFRYLGRKGSHLMVDLNHPLAEYPVTLSARVVEHLDPQVERGGLCNDIAFSVTDNGPGLQAGRQDMDMDILHGSPFSRVDEGDDTVFYGIDHFVDHVDAAALSTITSIYSRLLKPGMMVLDLMSSRDSHLSGDLDGLSVTGLGLNQDDLEKNGRLSERVTCDLNLEPRLPFQDAEFDAAVCSLSVEYLIEPIRVFREVARVLRPGAPFIVTFSNRWFQPKVIALWTELQLFERMGLVLEYFRKSGGFGNLNSESVRGLPRPVDDPSFPDLRESDPVFAVWGEALS
ncbi:MAG: methyltransferase domain-containing protein [bacterium]